MKLISLELGGFKSFAKATTLQFGPGLTGIIGPNGSGKSNLAEAIRWVLGEQSAKQLRAQAREDVLFAGTTALKRAGRAYVRLTFDNEDGRFPVEAAEVSVARSLTGGGESEYAVNGEEVRLLDLQRMLAEAGIGTKSYTVISQGMVDRYLAAGVAERRVLFDEACGIKPLQLRLLQAQRKLARTREHAADVQLVIQELAPRLATLERAARKQAERATLEAEYARKQAAWLHHSWYERQGEEERLATLLAELTARAREARRERETVSAQVFADSGDASTGVPTTSWTVRARSVLDQCRSVLTAWTHRQTVTEEMVQAVLTEIQGLLAGARRRPSAEVTGKAALDAALEAELTAEREVTTAQIGWEQAQRERAQLQQEIVRERGSAFLHEIQTTPPPAGKVSERHIRALGESLARLGEIDPLTLREYAETQERLERLSAQLQDVQATAATIETAAAQLQAQIETRFSQQFRMIEKAFQDYVSQLFGGGTARLTILEDGIEIEATPPGKRSKHIGLLSGGERALISLALLLAVVDAQTPPFLVLDEVDAALDEANSARFAGLLQTKARHTQCIVITHNRETMSSADVLYGVTMQQPGLSTVYGVKLTDVVQA